MTDEATVPPQPGNVRPSTIAGARNAAADAVRFFTRLPTPQGWTNHGVGPGDLAANGTAAASPLAGALVGLLAGAALVVSLAAGLTPLPAAVAAAIAATLASGALHLDGLADVADGFGGGSRERRLEIMRDSRLGTFGGAALILALMLRVSLVAALVGRLGAGDATLAVIAAAALSRPLAFLPAIMLEPARADGVGRRFRPSARAVAIGIVGGSIVAFAGAGPAMGIAAIALAGSAGGAVVAAARAKFGGYTGDVCGASSEAAELAALAGLLAMAV